MQRFVFATSLAAGLIALMPLVYAQTNCKLCADQQKACMKNYAGPACSTEYKICMKSCKK